MKKSTFILGIVSVMTLCLTACGKPNMSFEDAVDSITNSEIGEMMVNAEYYQQNFSISTDFSESEDNVQANIKFSTNSKQNIKDSEGETKITLKIDASGDGDEGREYVKIDGEAMIKYLNDAIYLNLNSLDIDLPEDFYDEFDFDLSGIMNQRFSFELTDEMKDKIHDEMPEGFEQAFDKIYDKKNLQTLKDNLKKAINNEGSLVYSGIYSEFNGYNAWKFSINKEKAFESFVEYIKTVLPEEYAKEFDEEFEDMDMDEIFEDFPLTNFEGYLVITGKHRVQIVIENLDIEDYYSTAKLSGTFGRDRYELNVKEDDEELFLISAKLSGTHYDVSIKVEDEEVLKGTITPRKSHGKISINFDLDINYDDYGDKINIPLNGEWSWEKISKFNIEKPANSKNLLEDISEDMEAIYIPYYLFTKGINNGTIGNIGTPFVAGGIMMAALMPRMQSAQERARDVARKTALSQLQSAIVTYQGDYGKWPGMDKGAVKGITIDTIEDELMDAGLSSIPTDPYYNSNYGLGENYNGDNSENVAYGEYLYLPVKRNGVKNGGFVLMAKTEVAGGSNWVVCMNRGGSKGLDKGYITNDTDISEISMCNTITQGDSCGINEGKCTYEYDRELRYLVTY